MDRLLASRQSLAEALRAHGVVPVLGPEMVLVEDVDAGGARSAVPFYRVVADKLLATYDSAMPDASIGGGAWVLHRAVAQVLATNGNRSSERVRRSVSAIVKETAAGITASALLDRLAGLRAFDLFICLTPDDLLVDALQRVLGADAVEWGWLLALAVTVLVAGLMTYAAGSPAAGPSADEDLADYERRPTPTLFLTDSHGDRHNLLDLSLQQARFVVYANMGCGACMTVIDALPAFQAENPELAVHVLVQRYDDAARARLDPSLGVFVDPELIFTQFFQLSSPGAVLFGADGMLAGGPSNGSNAVQELMADITTALTEGRAVTETETPR